MLVISVISLLVISLASCKALYALQTDIIAKNNIIEGLTSSIKELCKENQLLKIDVEGLQVVEKHYEADLLKITCKKNRATRRISELEKKIKEQQDKIHKGNDEYLNMRYDLSALKQENKNLRILLRIDKDRK